MDARGVVERVWPRKEADVEELGGGITNRNVKVTVNGDAYVLRIGGKDTDLLGFGPHDLVWISSHCSRGRLGLRLGRHLALRVPRPLGACGANHPRDRRRDRHLERVVPLHARP